MNLAEKYGKVYGKVQKEDFVRDLKESFERRMTDVFTMVDQARDTMNFPRLTEQAKTPYREMEERIIQKRKAQLSDEFIIPSATSALAEVQSETESQSESQSQSQSQTQTHSFSEVANEEVVIEARLRKYGLPLEAISISYLSQSEELQQLARANQVVHMQHLFNEDDPICCSPTYQLEERLAKEFGNPLPPVRYFLAREEGNPKVILINQDEANLFKAAPVSPPWSLYDVRMKKGHGLAPITGAAIESLKDSLLKKLYFSSYRHQITGDNIASLAKSLDGICTSEQLQPSLDMQFKGQNISQEKPPFILPQWGFHGDKQQDILLQIEQTNLVFKERFEKRGVTISLGEGEGRAKVFISSKLNKRILAEMEKPAQKDLADSQSKLKKVVEQIKEDYNNATEERANLREQLKNYKKTKKMIIDDFDQRIASLEKRKLDAISCTKTKMASLYVEGMKGVVNLRDYHEKKLDQNINSLSSMRLGNNKEWGTRIGWGKYFVGIAPMIDHFLNEIHKADQVKTLTPEELNRKINEYTGMIYDALSGRYEVMSHSSRQDSTIMEAMHAASHSPGKDIKLWSMNLNDVLKSQFNDLYSYLINREGKSDDEKYKVWREFETCIGEVITSSKGKNLSFEDFDQKIYEEIRQFAIHNKNKFKNPDISTTEIMNRLSCSFTPGPDKEANLNATKNAIVNIIYNRFLQVAQTPSEERRDLYARIYENIIQRKPDIQLPATLESPPQGAISREELSAAVQELLRVQNIRVTSKLAGIISQRCARYVAGYKWLEYNLDHFIPVKDRSPDLGKIDAFKAELFPDAQKELARLDEEVLVIQQEINEARIQKAEQLAALENKYRELPGKIQNNTNRFAELKGEKSALNKLLSGINKLLSVFKDHQVVVDQDDAVSFLDTHFDLGKIIRDDVSASAILTFIPPEFYSIEEDMHEQFVHLHGLDEAESQAKSSLEKAAQIVRDSAVVIQERGCHVTLELLGQKTAQQTVYTVDEEQIQKKEVLSKVVDELIKEVVIAESPIPNTVTLAEEEQIRGEEVVSDVTDGLQKPETQMKITHTSLGFYKKKPEDIKEGNKEHKIQKK
ncbi:hypothetical protein EP47_03820 [Legionella norrlandica]|uniref:Uncharacterized protein n=1 Tax=Legionella norrlandica TaxID=1498499 RepID=A0A0A2SRU2_9GAMM|nr:hypothetical protein [Legionella norrlandica]KGP62421.1 hypothetical protein EP47_03820 [Legionella norrlandica]